MRISIATAAALAVTAALLTAPAPTAGAAPPVWRTPQQLAPVPTTPVRAPAPPRSTAADLAAKAPAIAAPRWPAAGAADVDLEPSLRGAVRPVWVRAGGQRVLIGPIGTAAPARVHVETLVDKGTPMVRLARADGGTGESRVTVGIDYAAMASAYGGDWGGRLRATMVTGCAACPAVAIPFHNDRSAQQVVADVTLPGSAQAVTVALTAGDSSTAGSYAATALKPSATWSGGGSTGDFTWSYPLRTPPALNGPAPKVEFSYSSQSLDGLTSATNNQASWLGDGFTYDPGFIERRYKSCVDDGHPNTGDNCWGTDNATLVMAGHGGELIQISTSPDVWRPTRDDGTRVERLRDTSVANGDNDGEYWKVTTTDGAQYFFGRNHITGWATGRPETASVSYTTVFGDDAGEPCYNATYASAYCTQAYRWGLDYVVDTHGNTMSLWYARDTNNYSRNVQAASVSTYVRDRYLTRVDYGTDNRTGTDSTFTGTAPARVQFAAADRCSTSTGCTTHDLAHWPDVPWDRECTSATDCTGKWSPTYWSTRRLSTVTTQVAIGAQAWKDVDRWALAVRWLDPAAGDQSRIMWLDTVTRTGLNGTTPGITLPPVTFGPTGSTMPNRVKAADGNGAFRRYRLGTIANETGAVLGIAYSPADCVDAAKMPASPETNTYRCFPVYWTPPGGSQILDYFHKYVVTSVSQADTTGAGATDATTYAYPADGAFWHYDTSELTPAGKKTWAQWRGYDQVTVTRGAAGETQSQSTTRYFRGRDGDHLPSGTRSQSYPVNGTSYADSDWLAGIAFQATVPNGPGGAVVTETFSEPWSSGPTASRTVDGVTTSAYATGTFRTTVRTPLDHARPDRLVVTTRTFTDGSDGTPRGRVLTESQEGDAATGADDTCTRYTYARNDAANLHSLVAQIETDALKCSVAPTQASHVLSIARTYYDGGTTYPTVPGAGDVTRTEELTTWSATPASRTFVATRRTTYDPYGRLQDVTDALDHTTKTRYTPASGGPVTAQAVTNPMLWTTTSQLEPAWGLATQVTDQNSRVTELGYDALGRMTAAWLPGWSRTAHPTVASKAFAYTIRASGGPSAVATSVLNTAGTGYWTTYELYDGLLRSRQTQATAPTGSGRLISDTVYDSRGLVVSANPPYYTTGTAGTGLVQAADAAVPQQTRTAFDGAGRQILSQEMSQGSEKWHTATAYGGDRTDVTPPAGGTATSTITDANGRTLEKRQYYGTTPTPWTAGTYDSTTYVYDHAGRMTKLTDPRGSIWTWGFDQRGRATTTGDPDRGTTTSTFDDVGQLLTAQDSRGTTLSYHYDALERKDALWQGAVGTGTQLAGWTYDTLLLGQPTAAIRYIGGDAYTTATTGYDTANRATGTDVTIPTSETGLGTTYSFTTSYNANGSVASVGVPAVGGLPAETLALTYNSRGLPLKLTGATTYVSDTTYLQTGQLTSITNNTTESYQSFDYDLATKRLAHHTVQAATTPDVLRDAAYTMDAAGNLQNVADLNDKQCFRYDELRRVTDAWTPNSGDCAAAPATAGLGGAAPYWLSWTYDAAGDRKTQTAHLTGGDQTVNYTYPAGNAAQPHKLTATTGTVATTYGYDLAGNTTSRPGSAGQQTLGWDAESRLGSVSDAGGSTSYVYDPAGVRLITRDATGRTLHLPAGTELHVSPTGTNPVGTRRYSYSDRTIATRTGSGGVTWLFGDQQNTAQVAFTSGTGAVQKRYTTPFGTPRGSTPAWPDKHAFLGAYADPTGLMHLGAREYDPATGRFISLDPIARVENPQQMQGYSYADNNPATLTDPTGLEPGSWCKDGACSRAAELGILYVPDPITPWTPTLAPPKISGSSPDSVKFDGRGQPRAPGMIDPLRPADYVVVEYTQNVYYTSDGRRVNKPVPTGTTTFITGEGEGTKRKPSAVSVIPCGGVFETSLCLSMQEQADNQVKTRIRNGTMTSLNSAGLLDSSEATYHVTTVTGVVYTRTGETYFYAGEVQPSQDTPSTSVRWGWIGTGAPPTQPEIRSFFPGIFYGASATLGGMQATIITPDLTNSNATKGYEIGYTTGENGFSSSVTDTYDPNK